MSETTDFWAGNFGDQYTSRNRVNWRARIPFWDRLVAKYGFRSVYEVGCGPGWNLSAIKHGIHGYNVQLYGCEINAIAETRAKYAGFNIERMKAEKALPPYDAGIFELAFTAGVLIHIAPEDLKRMMQAIIDASCDYVLCIEYEADHEEEVLYRGHSGKLWKRPYGQMYMDMGLELVETGKLDDKDGFDPNGVTFSLLRKP